MFLRFAALLVALGLLAIPDRASAQMRPMLRGYQPTPYDAPRPKPFPVHACAAWQGDEAPRYAAQRLEESGAYLAGLEAYSRDLEGWRAWQLIGAGAWSIDDWDQRRSKLHADPQLVRLLQAYETATDQHDRALLALSPAGRDACAAIADQTAAENLLIDLDFAIAARLDELYRAEAARAGLETEPARLVRTCDTAQPARPVCADHATDREIPPTRPPPFRAARPAAITAVSCAALPRDQLLPTANRRVRASNDYANALDGQTIAGMQWGVRRLGELGVWPKEDKPRLTRFQAMMADPQINAISARLRAIEAELDGALDKLEADAARGEPQASLCRQAAAISEITDRYIDTYLERDRRSSALFAAEAGRAGVRME